MGGLEPLKNTVVTGFLHSYKSTLDDLLEDHSSPLNIIFPQIFIDNINGFKAAFSYHGMKENIFFSSKANKSSALIKTAAHANIGLEVGSYYELQNALEKGVYGSKIIASGPGKTEKYLLLCLRRGARISIDSKTELTDLIELCKELKVRAHAIIRINITGKSKFGLGVPLDQQTLNLIKNNNAFVDVVGVSGHIDGNYGLDARVKMIRKGIKICEQLKKAGCINCRIIDIGGGFTVRYTTEKAWRNFKKGKIKFWRNKHFSSFYPYYTRHSGAAGLKYILESETNGKKVYDILKSKDYELAIEPGRALLDQAGITIMKIIERKQIGEDWLVVVDANINHLSEQWFNTDFLVSPELITQGKRRENSFEGYIAGNLCLEQDMISWHKVKFRKMPMPGDLLVFYNTAGYQMDSNESEFMRIPMAKKVIAIKNEGRWELYEDDSFSQVDLLKG